MCYFALLAEAFKQKFLSPRPPPSFLFYSFFFFFPFPNRLSPAPSEPPFSPCVAAGPWQRLPAEGQGCSLGSDAAS